jgi:hypothetical protein
MGSEVPFMPTPRPTSLTWILNKLSGYSAQHIKRKAETPLVAKAGDTIVLNLPENAYLDLRSLRMNFDGIVTGLNTNTVLFPKHIETIFDNISFEAGGYVVSPGPGRGLNQIFKMLADFTLPADASAKRTIAQNGDLLVQGLLKDQSNVDSAPTPVTMWRTEAGKALTQNYHQSQKFIMSNMLGFLQCSPPTLATHLLGVCKVYLRLASKDVLVSSDPNDDYRLENIEFTVKSIAIDDGYFTPLLEKRVASGGLLYSWPEYRYFQFGTRSVNGVSRISVSAQSLDWVAAWCQGDTLPSKASQAYGNLDGWTGTSAYFSRGSGGAETSQWQVLGVTIPQFPARCDDEVWAATTLDLGTLDDTVGGYTAALTAYPQPNWRLAANGDVETFKSPYTTWTGSHWVHFLRLNYQTADEDRIMSGLSTRGASGEILHMLNGGSANIFPIIATSQTATLRVLPMRTIDVTL